MLNWLQELVAAPATIWQTLNVDPSDLPKIGTVEAHLNGADAVYYSARLIDAICRQASRENVGQSQANQGGSHG